MSECDTCFAPMNPAEKMLGPTCGKCCRENEKIVAHPRLEKAILANRAQRRRTNERTY